MTKLGQDSYSKTFQLLCKAATRACVPPCLHTLLFCFALLNTFFPFPLTPPPPKITLFYTFNFSVWESIAASAGPQGPLQWLLIVTWCAPAGESGDIKELVCVVCHRTQQGAAITETDERRSALPLLLTQSILAPSSTECTLGQAQEQISIQVFYITTSWSYL